MALCAAPSAQSRRAWDSGTPETGHWSSAAAKGLLRILFGHIEVPEKSDQCGHDPAPVRAVDFFYGRNSIRYHRAILRFFSFPCRFGASPFD